MSNLLYSKYFFLVYPYIADCSKNTFKTCVIEYYANSINGLKCFIRPELLQHAIFKYKIAIFYDIG